MSQVTPGRSATTTSQRQTDPNAPQNRLFLNQQCIYERRLPGDSYITAHITRLQSGYYDTPAIHEDCINDVRFIGINFVFHPVDTRHRFVSARISLSVHDRDTNTYTGIPLPPQLDPSEKDPGRSDLSIRQKPKILRFAPHLLYGALSPETLDWNFNLAGSLGVTQGPANLSVKPSGGLKSSYKVYKMMKIQGSVRTLSSWYGRENDVEDGEIVWTLEENSLQKSGLPREFTFVMMLTKGHSANDVMFNIHVDPVVASWYGTYPTWWLQRIWYLPLPKPPIDLDKELGQKFQPSNKNGFNFANLMGRFDDFVSLPGTTYSSSDQPTEASAAAPNDKMANKPRQPAQQQQQPMQSILGGQRITASPAPDNSKDKDLNIRVFIEGYQPPPLSSQNAAAPYSQSSRSSLPIQSTSPLPDTGFSIAKPRSRPVSSALSPLPLTPKKTSATKQRPVSATYERVSTPPMAPSTGSSQPSRKQRPLSNVTDASEDLYTQSTSPSSYNTSTLPRTSKSLRHRRSRSGLTDEFSSPDSHTQHDSPPEQTVRLKRSNPSARNTVSDQRPQSYHQPTNTTASTLTPSGTIIGPTRRASQKSKPENPPPATSTTNSDSLSPPPPSALALKRHSLSPQSSTNQTELSSNFPPTSYPSHSMASGISSYPNATAPPPSINVDGIVQREVDNFLRAHPELRSPVHANHRSSHGRKSSHMPNGDVVRFVDKDVNYTAGADGSSGGGNGNRRSGYADAGWEYVD